MPHSRWVAPAVADLVVAMFGDDARRWLATLDTRVAHLAATWGLSDLATLPGAGVSAVLAARHRDHGDVVLKLAPTGAAVPYQARALRAWRDTADAHRLPCPLPVVLALDEDLDAVLLERVPGTPLTCRPEPGPDELATVAAMLELVRRTDGTGAWDGGLGHTHDESRTRLRACTDPGWARRAHRLADVLDEAHTRIGTPDARHLLHGDLWPPNVLAAPSRHTVIDPWPQCGPAASDAGFWAATAAAGSGAEARCAALAPAAGAPPERIWAFAAFWAAARVALTLHHRLNPAPLDGLAAAAERWASTDGRLPA